MEGLQPLIRSFKNMGGDIHKELNDALKDAAKPVEQDAQHLALTQIRNMPKSPRWAGMRTGVSVAQGVVYVVPAAKRRAGGSPRPRTAGKVTIADMIQDRALDPALERNAAEIERKVDHMLGQLAGENGWV